MLLTLERTAAVVMAKFNSMWTIYALPNDSRVDRWLHSSVASSPIGGEIIWNSFDLTGRVGRDQVFCAEDLRLADQTAVHYVYEFVTLNILACYH
jgi:hypothetical protein